MYAREAGGRKLTLGVSGMLWKQSLVMYDRETNSLWSHILGQAVQGRLKGQKLKQIPSVMTDWETWRRQHPDGGVAMLSRSSRQFRREMHQRGGQFVLGIERGGKAMAWSFAGLERQPLVYHDWDDSQAVVVFDRRAATARLYDRRVNGRLLSFVMIDGRLQDKETGSTWEPASGKAVAGPLQGQSLTPLPAIVSFTNTWLTFHPQSRIWPRR